MDEQLYEIQEGVRRTKAAWLCGHETIAAQVNGGAVFFVPPRCLRSPHKDEIDVSGLGGTRGKAIEEVRVPQDELDLFR